jgi:hypothetical protein
MYLHSQMSWGTSHLREVSKDLQIILSGNPWDEQGPAEHPLLEEH